MAGNQCEDIGGATVNGASLCVIPDGSPYSGLVTYSDGRVATLVSDDDGHATFLSRDGKDKITIDDKGVDIKKTKKFQGTELGDCVTRGNQRSLSFLQTTYKGTPVSWGPAELKEVYRILGQDDGQSDNAFLCSDRNNRPKIALNNDGAHLPSLRAAIDTLEKDHGKLDDLHYHALLESLRTAAGLPAEASHGSDLFWVGVVFTVVHFVGALGVWAAGKLFGGDKGDKGGKGGGGGGDLIDMISKAYQQGVKDAQQNVQANPADALTPLPEGDPKARTSPIGDPNRLAFLNWAPGADSEPSNDPFASDFDLLNEGGGLNQSMNKAVEPRTSETGEPAALAKNPPAGVRLVTPPRAFGAPAGVRAPEPIGVPVRAVP